MLTALEIFTNPWDLLVLVGKDGGKWGFTISRGPGHNYKLLVDSNGFAETEAAAIEELKGKLEAVSADCTKAFEDQANALSKYILPEQQTLDQSKVLNSELIAQVVGKLQSSGLVKTYEMSLPAS